MVLFFEGILRIFYPPSNDPVIYYPKSQFYHRISNFSGFQTNPNYWHHREFRIPVQRNSRGFTGTEYPYAHPGNILRIVTIGDVLDFQVEIVEGLVEGDQVILGSGELLSEGEEIELNNTNE